MSAARRAGIAELLVRNPVLGVALAVLLALAVWYAIAGSPGAPLGAACETKGACDSGICLPDADPQEVARFIEFIKAYEQGQDADPNLAGQIEQLLQKMPRSSLTLRPEYPGVCTARCEGDPDCPQGMFCAEAVWVRAFEGIDGDRLRVCMPDDHPAARLVRR